MTENENCSLRKRAILREAACLFREQGYRASTLRELAKRSGILVGSLYHHFSSKHEILFQLMDRTMTDLIDKLSQQIMEKESAEENLLKAIYFHIQYHVSDPDSTYITDEELRNLENDSYGQILKKRKAYQAIFENIIAKGINQGTMVVPDKKIAVRVIIQICNGVPLWFKHDGGMSIKDIAESYFNLLSSGISVKRGH